MGERDKPHSYPFIMVMRSLMERLMMITPEGGWSPPEVDPDSVSLLRSSPAAAFCLLFYCFVFLRRLLAKLIRGLFL